MRLASLLCHAVFLLSTIGLLLPTSVQAQDGDTAVSTAELRAQGLFVRGMTQARLSNFEGAIEAYTAALDLVGDDVAILLALAEAYRDLGNTDDALFFAEQAAEAAPEALAPLLLAADLYQTQDRLNEALDTYARALDRHPEADDARAAQASLLQDLDRLDEAIAAQRARLSYLQDPRPARQRLIILYEEAGQPDRALAEVEALLADNPTSYVVRLDLARRYLNAERTSEARRVLDALRADYPHDPQVALLLARAMQSEDAGGATALLADLGASSDPDALFGQAAALFNRAQNDPSVRGEAMAALERLLEIEARPDALYMLATLHYDAEAFGEAAALMARAVAAEPRRPDWWGQALDASLRANDGVLAERLADDALLLFPGQPALVDLASLAFQRVERHADAARALRTLSAPTALQLERLGDAEEAAGNAEAARAAWERALDLDPDNARLRTKLTRTP
ncbi:MAG: tetratricopeptide repeat protein [Bacteroidota bacterium]